MSLQTLAFLTTLGYFICIQINYGIGQCMTERPIVVGALIGVLLGDIKTGVTIGAALEVAFMGIVNIGGVTATDAATSTAIATAFAVYSGLSVEEAVAVAIPVGLVSNMFFNIIIQLSSLGAPVLEKICKSGNEKQLYIYQFVMWLVVFGIKSVIVYVGVLAGADPITALVSQIPAVISTGLTVASGLLGAVGMAMLMRMLWTKEVAVFYFLGFVFITYLNLPTMGIAAIGLILAISIGLREKQIFDLEKKIAAGPAAIMTTAVSGAQEEEDFLS